MLNSGKKYILTLVSSEIFFMNETKNHNPPLQVKWSVPYNIHIYTFQVFNVFLIYIFLTK